MSKWQNVQVKRAVKIHADADTQENKAEFYLTPAQARLVWWGMRCLANAIRESVADCQTGADYADDLRCHADADEWGRGFMSRLAGHAEKDSPSIVQEGVICH
jgi:hypothetical protein